MACVICGTTQAIDHEVTFDGQHQSCPRCGEFMINAHATQDPMLARAAAWVAGADRWSEARWRDLEAQVAPPNAETSDPNIDEPAPQPIAGRLRNPTRRGRRVFRSTYLT